MSAIPAASRHVLICCPALAEMLSIMSSWDEKHGQVMQAHESRLCACCLRNRMHGQWAVDNRLSRRSLAHGLPSWMSTALLLSPKGTSGQAMQGLVPCAQCKMSIEAQSLLVCSQAMTWVVQHEQIAEQCMSTSQQHSMGSPYLGCVGCSSIVSFSALAGNRFCCRRRSWA